MTDKQHICACGKLINPPRNSTIWAKECPNCQLKKAVLKNVHKIKNDTKRPTKERFIKTPPPSIDKKLDNVWSQLVKLRAGNKCESCGSTQNLNSHHIYSRAKKSLRWNLNNGICLCVGHHIGTYFSAHKTPLDFINWLIVYKGEVFVRDLEITANMSFKWSLSEKQLLLSDLKKELNDLKEQSCI
jgi:hypothetical protein